MTASPAPRWHAPLLSAAVALAACGDESELVVAEGDLIDIQHEAEFQLCSGTLAAYERGIESTAEQLGLDVEEIEHMSISWLTRSNFADRASFYRSNFDGQASGAEALSVRSYYFHEVVHMIAHNESSGAAPLLSEGLATAFEEKAFLTDLRDPRPFFGARHRTTPAVDYDAAGSFVSYLLGRYGPERFWELYADLGYLSTAGRLRRRFAAIYGRELDDEVEEYLRGECPEDALPIPLPPSCAADEIPWGSDGTWTYVRALDCSEDDVAGGIGGESPGVQVEHVVTFVVDEAGYYDVRRVGDHDFYALLYRCGGCPWLNSPTNALSQHFEAGRYSLRIVDAGEVEGVSLGLKITPR
jgi:hypothetical protein